MDYDFIRRHERREQKRRQRERESELREMERQRRSLQRQEIGTDTMQACTGCGNVISCTCRMDGICPPLERCGNCGEPTIMACPSCGRPIPGRDYTSQVMHAEEAVAPAYCRGTDCGEPFPWTIKAQESAQELAAMGSDAQPPDVPPSGVTIHARDISGPMQLGSPHAIQVVLTAGFDQVGAALDEVESSLEGLDLPDGVPEELMGDIDSVRAQLRKKSPARGVVTAGLTALGEALAKSGATQLAERVMAMVAG